MSHVEKRTLTIIGTHVSFMCVLGFLAFLISEVRDGGIRNLFDQGRWADAVFAALFVGGSFGLTTSMVSALVLCRADYMRELAMVFGLAALPTAAVVWFDFRYGVETAAWTAAITVVGLLVLRALWKPQETAFWNPREGFCDGCGFDLRGLREPGCPECGLGRDGGDQGTPSDDEACARPKSDRT